MNNINSLDQVLEGVSTVAISGHVRPDGDCVGSTLAVYNYIKDNYEAIDVRLYLEPIPNIFKFLRYSSEIINECTDENIFDLFIALDCSDKNRLGNAAKYFENAKKTVCIDHHVSNVSFAENNYIFPDASSTCELVYELIGRDKLTKEIAECLYTGMVHDTGVFQYSCTSAKTMNIGGILMESGIDYSKIVDETFYTKTFNQNKILGKALLKSELYLDGKVILSCITQKEMEEFDVLPKHLDGIVNQLRITKDVRIAVFLYENEDGSYKGSLRVNDNTNVAEIAATFGGGGHVKAAGFSIDGPLEEAVEKVIKAIQEKM